ncbi:FAD/NAD(P)-binding domain-containing protein, partial [Punctularia strigosozonata HHB-11173 SS5]|uniref:FAD/NAD(P)-binding domain-containing protein n=1 Tax=Punctularia strigosozonata (strain HHB-11173) TaxID=741275 RepID=UPI000441668F
MRPFILSVVFLISRCVAQLDPSSANYDDVQVPFQNVEVVNVTHRIAIIGAGAGGSSAAFWLGKASERLGLNLEVDVFEREDYIGGRSTTVQPYDDPNLRAIELGASIFVSANKNLWRAVSTEEWNLTRDDFDYEEGYDTGIWDGSQFLLVVGGGSGVLSWWETLKVIWRYGWTAPTRTQNIIKQLMNKFLTLYEPTAPTWTSIEQLAEELQWSALTSQSSAEYFDLAGVSKKFSREMIEAATRVNYGQNLDQIHALEGVCSLAATGASAVKGGNWKIFERFLAESKANVYLNTTIKSAESIQRADGGSAWELKTSASDRLSTKEYDSVILAAPFHSTGIEFPRRMRDRVPKQPYVHLHVTLLTTTS